MHPSTHPRLAALTFAAALTATPAFAIPITYDIDQAIGLGSVVGTIQTDGKTGTLAQADILAWNLTLNGVGATFNITQANSIVQLVGADLTATLGTLSFDLSGVDKGYLLFQQGLYSGSKYYCDATSSDVCYQGASVVPQHIDDPSAQSVPTTGSRVIGTAAVLIPEPDRKSVV